VQFFWLVLPISFPLSVQIRRVFLGSNPRLSYTFKILKMSFLTKISIDWPNDKFNSFPCVIMTLVSWTIGTKQTNKQPSFMYIDILKIHLNFYLPMIVSKFRFFKNWYEMYPHLINKINNKQSKFQLDFGVSIFKTNHNIKTDITFRIITHLIEFWFFIKIWIEMPFTHFTLFIIFIEHQFKRVLKQFFFLFLLGHDHALHIQFTW